MALSRRHAIRISKHANDAHDKSSIKLSLAHNYHMNKLGLFLASWEFILLRESKKEVFGIRISNPRCNVIIVYILKNIKI